MSGQRSSELSKLKLHCFTSSSTCGHFYFSGLKISKRFKHFFRFITGTMSNIFSLKKKIDLEILERKQQQQQQIIGIYSVFLTVDGTMVSSEGRGRKRRLQSAAMLILSLQYEGTMWGNCSSRTGRLPDQG